MTTTAIPRLNADHVRQRLFAYVAEHQLPEPLHVRVWESKSATLLGPEFILSITLASLSDATPWAQQFDTEVQVVGTVNNGVFRAWVDVPCPSRIEGVPAFFSTISWWPDGVA